MQWPWKKIPRAGGVRFAQRNRSASRKFGAGRRTKIALILNLLTCKQGATLAELIEATSWQPLTTRAALTGLRERGHAIDRGKRGDETYYRVPEIGRCTDCPAVPCLQ